jgi:hypothetical protein
MLISLAVDQYRCVTCGTDLEQKINGVIKYIPAVDIEKRVEPKHSG